MYIVLCIFVLKFVILGVKQIFRITILLIKKVLRTIQSILFSRKRKLFSVISCHFIMQNQVVRNYNYVYEIPTWNRLFQVLQSKLEESVWYPGACWQAREKARQRAQRTQGRRLLHPSHASFRLRELLFRAWKGNGAWIRGSRRVISWLHRGYLLKPNGSKSACNLFRWKLLSSS